MTLHWHMTDRKYPWRGSHLGKLVHLLWSDQAYPLRINQFAQNGLIIRIGNIYALHHGKVLPDQLFRDFESLNYEFVIL